MLLGPALRPYLDSVDLVQSVHRSLILGFRNEKYDISSPEKLIALALTIVRRKVARQWRHLQRQQRLRSGNSDSSAPGQFLASLPGHETDPARAAQLNDAVRHVRGHLDPTEQHVLEMHLQGYNMAEIAGQVGISPVALRVRLARLRHRLRTAGIFADWV